MKQGLKKFTSDSQGARTKEGKEAGEKFVEKILTTLSIKDLKECIKNNFSYQTKDGKTNTKLIPDFIINNSKTGKEIFNDVDYIILESKYKQIAGSDWEKIESNFGYHEYFYNKLIGFKSKTIVVLSGYWKKLQNNYPVFMEYFKYKYGENSIFDFGESYDEILRFCKLLDIDLNYELVEKIKKIWNDENKIPD